MEEINFTLPSPPSTNMLFRNLHNGRRVKTRQYKDFLAYSLSAIRQQLVEPVKGYVMMVIAIERVSKLADIDNRLKALLDAIVKAGVIEDDRFVTAIAVSWAPLNEGLAHVSIYPVQGMQLDFYPAQDGACGGFYKTSLKE